MSKGVRIARELLDQYGIDDPSEIPLETLIYGRDAIIREKPLSNCDGRIVFGNKKSIITINSNIEFEGKRRFVLAHELGHHEMHRNEIPVHFDNDATLQYFKNGNQETQANEFASEILMPSKLFLSQSERKRFSPELLRELSNLFLTSLTSTVYRYFDFGRHPICLIYSYNNVVKYWKRPDEYPHFLINRINLPPPEGSVAYEFFNEKKIYTKANSKQRVWKSTWFNLNREEDDNDTNFYEFCIITPKYNTVLSVIWEEI